MPFQTYYNADTKTIVMTTDPLNTSPEFINSRSPTIQTPHLEDSDTLYEYSSESPHLHGDYNFLQSPQEQVYLTTNMFAPYSLSSKEDVSFYDFSNTNYSTPIIETIPIPHFNGDPKLLVIDKSKITELKPNYYYNQNTQDFIAKPEEDDQDQEIENQKLLLNNNNATTAAEQSAENKVHLFPPLSSPGCPKNDQVSESAVNKALGYGSDSPLSELADDDDMTSQLSYDEEEEESDQVKQEPLSDEEYQEDNREEEQVQENNGDNGEEEEHNVEEESPSRKRRADSSSDSDNEDYNPEPRKKKRRQYKKTAVTKRKNTGVTKQKKAAAVDIGRPYKCPYCDHASKRRYNLTTHVKTHNKDRIKDFPCDVCDKGFDRKHDRDRHVATVHLGKRSHVCQLCSAHFSRGDALNRHMVQKHDYDDDDVY